MKKLTDKVQRLSQCATQLREAIESVPPKVAEIRDAVTAATGEVQKLRDGVIASLATLRAETDAQLVSTLREIEGGTDVLSEAGCRLEGIDLDLGATRRLVVRLVRVKDVDAARLRALSNENASRPAIHALLNALLKADELALEVKLTRLRHTHLTVDIGLIPSARMGWRAETSGQGTQTLVVDAKQSRLVAPAVTTSVAASTELNAPSTSFFERRPTRESVPAPAPVATVGSASAAEATAPSTVNTANTASNVSAANKVNSGTHVAGANRQRSALDRFKKMPDLTKRSG